MWIKKTNDELKLEKEKGRFSLKFPLIIALAIAVPISILSDKLGIRKYTADVRPLTWTEYFNKFPDTLLTALYIALVIYIIQVLLVKKSLMINPSNTKLCIHCSKVFSHSSVKCDCGGDLELLDNYKWQD